MKLFHLIIVLSLAAAWLHIGVPLCRAAENTNTCLECHLELDGELQKPAALFSADVHNIAGVSCAGCHGGDPTSEDADVAMSKSKGFRGKPSVFQIPEFCGKCHSDPTYMRRYNPSIGTDQLEKYWTSYHGGLIKKKNPKAAQCVSCHGVHDIRPVGDPRSSVYPLNVPQTCAHCHADASYMKPFGIPTDQYQKYAHSVHGEALLEKGDIGAPACNDCHGNHAATPPGVTSVARVCYQCHLAEGELFSKSPHKPAFDELDLPECVVCHSNHDIKVLTDAAVGSGQESICMQCHSEGDKGYQAAKEIKNAVLNLKERYLQAENLIAEAQAKGAEVSNEEFKLRDVRQALITTRKLIHTFDPEKVIEVTNKTMPVVAEIHQEGIQSLEDIKHRRLGFIAFTVAALIIILGLYLKIRQEKQ